MLSRPSQISKVCLLSQPIQEPLTSITDTITNLCTFTIGTRHCDLCIILTRAQESRKRHLFIPWLAHEWLASKVKETKSSGGLQSINPKLPSNESLKSHTSCSHVLINNLIILFCCYFEYKILQRVKKMFQVPSLELTMLTDWPSVNSLWFE